MHISVLPQSTAPPAAIPLDLSRIAQDLQIRKVQVESVVHLLDEGNTVPFITRYRKERTGGLNEEVIRIIQTRVAQQRHLMERKQTILKSIEGQGKLTDELRAAILAAETPKRLEDLYLPYKPKKRTLATIAREKGLEPLALAIWARDPAVANLAEVLPTLVDPEKQLPTPVEVLHGVQHILAEQMSEMAEVRSAVRGVLWETGKLCTKKNEKLKPEEGVDYKDYFQFTEAIRHIPPHRILAINRGEKEHVLDTRLEADDEGIRRAALHKLPLADHPHAEFLKTVAEDALVRLVLPSLDREIRRELTHLAEDHAVSVFARNLRSLLLQRPLRSRRVLAIDPAFRTGCKLAVLDEIGGLLQDAVIFPHAPQNKKQEARVRLEELIRKHQPSIIAIGNGTACRETEEMVADLIQDFEKRRQAPAGNKEVATAPAVEATPAAPVVVDPAPPATSVAPAADAVVPHLSAETPAMPAATEASPPATPATPAAVEPPPPVVDPTLPEPPVDLAYIVVNEAGASHYSASAVGREEFPDYDATLRGTISIGRRLQDPLSELVKIDPQNIGVGLYQHDVNPRHLRESLDHIVESCVNYVGVDLNTASVPLLRHVSGLNQHAARELVEYRKQNGPFASREQLLQVPGIGEARYVQAAGFLKINGGANALDRTWIHPESYGAAQQLLGELGVGLECLHDRPKAQELQEKLKALSPEEVAARLQIGVPTLRDLLEALSRPGRDPRDDLPPPIFKKGILKLEDLQPGMELKGTVLNVVDFGAFIDIGLKDSGLVHISQMANRYVKSPYDVVAVGDVVTIWVLTVDQGRRRVSLTMIKPGTERKPPEKREPAPRPEQRRPRPPRGRRPGPRGGPAPASQAETQTASGAPAASGAVRGTRPPPRQSGPPPRPPQQQPPPRPRKPHRAAPRPKLTKSALEGATPLRTFGELEAFFAAKHTPPAPAPAPPPPTPPAAAVDEPPPPGGDDQVASRAP